MAGEMFLSAVISTLIERTTDFLFQELCIDIGVEQDRQKLCRILPVVQAIVADAEEHRKADPAVRGWLLALKDVMYEAEDVLDELMYDAISKVVETENQPHKRARSLLSLPAGWSMFKNTVGSLFGGSKLIRVLKNIDVIFSEMNQFGFSMSQLPPPVLNRPRSHSYVVESTVIGRNADLEKVLSLILNRANQERVSVLPIVGMGGLGKTTLAQLVYNHGIIESHFELTLWVCVSNDFDVAHVAKAIIDLAIEEETQLPLDNMELIQRHLRQKLIGKRYFLVLDDVWNEIPSKWEQLSILLDCGCPGSVVLVTTRSEKVASIVSTISAYKLQGLNEDNLWGIFKQKAFGMGVNERPELFKIGKQLMKNCCGSPLVAATLGGLMSYKKEEKEWLDVLESNIWNHMAVKNEIMPVLKLSYENLPSHLKQCFAFCAVYPKNYEMDRDTLIQLWMANSFIPSGGNVDMTDKGVEIFNELTWRGFFQDVKKFYYSGECKMHDLIHDLAQSLVGDECTTLLNPDKKSDVLSNNTLHVSSLSTEAILGLFKKSSHLRTILSLPHRFRTEESMVLSVNLSKANSSRAISLREAPIAEIHAEPRILKHLRYLDLSRSSFLKVLPESLCTLYNLQTLKLSECRSLELLPNGMRHMRSLMHVYLEKCHSLKHMPIGLSKLRSLQTLTKYIVDPDIGCGIEELKDLNLGGQLQIYGLHKIGNQQEAKLSNLNSKKNLIRLYLSWCDNKNPYGMDQPIGSDPDADLFILDGLEPCGGVRVLKIRKYNGLQFSTWMHNTKSVLKNLTQLRLHECRRCTALPPLSQLPSLQLLYLSDFDNLKYICSATLQLAQGYVEQELNLFPNLRYLSLANLPRLERWQENDPSEITSLAFPQLHHLIIERCPNLDALPSCPLLSDLSINGETSIPSFVIHSFKSNGVYVFSA